MNLNRFGVDTSTLPTQFSNSELGRVLILDGDGPCYAATFDSKKLDTAFRKFKSNVYEKMFLCKADTARVHITPKGCLKNNRSYLLGEKPYQANRFNKQKPPLLEVLRSALATHFDEHSDIQIFPQFVVEADDAMVQDMHVVQNAVLHSDDKDLQIAPGYHYNKYNGRVETIGDRFGYIGMYTGNSNPKIIGRGTKFFWAQLLMGDSADNVKGIKYDLSGKLVGTTAAFKYLHHLASENDAANVVIDLYRGIRQNILAEAECLWLTRCAGDSAASYIWGLDLTPSNREFIQECFNSKYRMSEEEYADWQRIEKPCESLKELQFQWDKFRKELNCKLQ